MKTMLCAALLVVLAAPGYAQSFNMISPQSKMITQEEVDAEAARNKAYQSAIKKMPEQSTKKNDPWGNVRAGGAASTDQKHSQSGTK
jgi:hypothetical protein